MEEQWKKIWQWEVNNVVKLHFLFFPNDGQICWPFLTMRNKVNFLRQTWQQSDRVPFCWGNKCNNGKMASSKFQSWQTWEVKWIFGNTPQISFTYQRRHFLPKISNFWPKKYTVPGPLALFCDFYRRLSAEGIKGKVKRPVGPRDLLLYCIISLIV